MTISLDPKTARRLVTGELKNECARLDHLVEVDKAEKAAIRAGKKVQYVSSKRAKLTKSVEEDFRNFYGDTLLCTAWNGRSLYGYIAEPVKPDDDDTRPYHSIVYVLVYNTRSFSKVYRPFLNISTHAMERLLSRKHDTKVYINLKCEFTHEILNDLILSINTWFKDSDSVTEEDKVLKIETTTGIGVIVFTDSETIPTLVTWYPKDNI